MNWKYTPVKTPNGELDFVLNVFYEHFAPRAPEKTDLNRDIVFLRVQNYQHGHNKLIHTITNNRNRFEVIVNKLIADRFIEEYEDNFSTHVRLRITFEGELFTLAGGYQRDEINRKMAESRAKSVEKVMLANNMSLLRATWAAGLGAFALLSVEVAKLLLPVPFLFVPVYVLIVFLAGVLCGAATLWLLPKINKITKR